MEQNYIVATASTADRTREYLEEHKIPFISYNYVLGDESFEDDCLDSTRDEVYKKMIGLSCLHPITTTPSMRFIRR